METAIEIVEDYEFFSPYSDAFNLSPDDTYKRLRKLPSPFYWEQGGAWVATTYDHITAIQQDRRFSTNIANWEKFDAAETEGRSDVKMRLQGIMGGTGESHIRLKKLLMPFFMPEGVARTEPYIRAKIEMHLEALRGRSDFDVVGEYAKQIPIAVISHILGIPEALHDDFYTFAIAFLRLFSMSYSSLAAGEDAEELRLKISGGIEVIDRLIDDARRPGSVRGGVIGALVHAQENGLDMTDDQLVSVIGEIIAGGADTTVLAICHTVRRLLQQPELLELLHEQPNLWSSAVQEVLRYESVIKLGIRFPAEDIQLGNTVIGKGQMVLFLYGAGLRDPDVFHHPDSFLIARDNTKSIAFGRSGHACIGRHLAIAETSLAVNMLFRAFPRLKLKSAPAFNSNNRILREMLSLNVTT